MRVTQTNHCRVVWDWEWSFRMIPWHRQVISLIYGLGVILIALWALEQGSGGVTMILGVVGMSMLTLMLIFGVEINTVDVSLDGFTVDFTDTSSGDEDDAPDTEPNEDADRERHREVTLLGAGVLASHDPAEFPEDRHRPRALREAGHRGRQQRREWRV